MLRLLSLLATCTFLFACDHIHRAEIRNETASDLLLEITFNEEHLHEGYYASFQNMYPGFEHISALSIDTVHHVNVYLLASGESFPLHDAIARDPDFGLFKKISIIQTDTLVLSDSSEISAVFEHPNLRYWEWVIK